MVRVYQTSALLKVVLISCCLHGETQFILLSSPSLSRNDLSLCKPSIQIVVFLLAPNNTVWDESI